MAVNNNNKTFFICVCVEGVKLRIIFKGWDQRAGKALDFTLNRNSPEFFGTAYNYFVINNLFNWNAEFNLFRWQALFIIANHKLNLTFNGCCTFV